MIVWILHMKKLKFLEVQEICFDSGWEIWDRNSGLSDPSALHSPDPQPRGLLQAPPRPELLWNWLSGCLWLESGRERQRVSAFHVPSKFTRSLESPEHSIPQYKGSWARTQISWGNPGLQSISLTLVKGATGLRSPQICFSSRSLTLPSTHRRVQAALECLKDRARRRWYQRKFFFNLQKVF